MSKPNQSPQPRRGPLWLFVRAPGAAILWAEYHFPKHGDAWGSARRFGKPAFEVLYSLGFWLCVAAFLWSLLHRLLGYG
jgi:hypothetical protein